MLRAPFPALCCVAWSLGGCATPEDGLGLTGAGRGAVFPTFEHFDEFGHLDLERAELPPVAGGAVGAGDTAWRRGVSPAQLFVVQLDEVNASALPSWRAPTPGEGGVRLIDLDEGRWLPVMAELDAFPDQERPALLIRPLVALSPGHRVGVMITAETAPRTQRFDDLIRGRGPDAVTEPVDQLMLDLAEAGVDQDDVSLAWSVPIEDGRKPLAGALAAASPADVSWKFDDVRTGVDADGQAWRSVTGTLTGTGVLDSGGRVFLDADGGGQAVGPWETDIAIHIPQGVQNAAPGTVPVVVFGHGIFGSPQRYFDGRSGPDFPTIAQDGGMILVGVPWRGLSRSDLGLATGVAADIKRIPELTSLLLQSQVSVRQLVDALVQGDLLDDPVFLGADGQSLPRRGRVDYLGVSLGGIQGTLMVGMGAPVENAVLHVPGGMWSTMLERSSNFPPLESRLVNVVPDPADRQVLYAWSQLYWDYADPMSAAAGWSVDTPVLLQESLHDEQVPNLTTRALARSLGLPAAGPVAELGWGLEPVSTPTPAGTSAWVQHDPQREAPADQNRPAPVTNAHDAPRGFAGVQRQMRVFLETGVVEHPCGDQPCTPDNPGE